MPTLSSPVSLKPSFSYYGQVIKRTLFGSLRMKQLQITAAHARREKMKPQSASHRVRPIVLRAHDGTRLSGWLMTPRWPDVRGAVLYFTNGSEEALWLAAQAPVLFPEMTILVMHYRPDPGKDKRAAMADQVADGVMLYDWLAASHQHLPAFPIVLMGRHFGASVAARVAERRPAAALTLFSPCDPMVPMPSRLSQLLRRKATGSGQVFQFKQGSPVLVLRAEKDAIVPARRSQAFLACFPAGFEDKVFVGADHYDLPYRYESQEAVAAFLRQHATADLSSNTIKAIPETELPKAVWPEEQEETRPLAMIAS